MKIWLQFLGVAAGLALLGACATTPKPAPAAPAPQQQTQPQPQQASAPQAPSPDAELKQAKDLKAEIDQYQLSSQSPDTYKAGVAALSDGTQAMGSDNAAAKTKLDEAIADFQRVLDSGFTVLLQQEQQKVASAKTSAQAAKADKAAPDEFAKAQDLEKQAQQKQAAGANADAYTLLAQAVDQYNQAASVAAKKRDAAQAAVDQADSQIDQTKTKVQSLQQGLQADQGTGVQQ